MMKISTLKWHYETKHRNFRGKNNTNNTNKCTEIVTSSCNRILVTSMTQQQKATECSLRVVWILSKHKKPFSDAEININNKRMHD